MKHLFTATLAAGILAAAPALAQDIAIAVHIDPSNVMYKVAERMKAEIEDKSDMSVAVLGAEVGGERDQIEAASGGEYQIVLGGSIPMSVYAPKYAASDLPFVWSSSDEARKIYEGEIGEKVQEAFETNGNLHLVGLSLRNPRVLTSKKAVESAADVNGVRMRVPEIRTWIDVWSAIGALPSPIAWPEVYTSLQTGVIDMQENPVEIIYSAKLFEVQDFVAKTNHVYSFFHWLANNEWYQGLSEEDRAVVDAAVENAIAWGDQEVTSGAEGLYAELEKAGMTITEPDLSGFREAAKPAVEKAAEAFAPEVRDYVLSKLN